MRLFLIRYYRKIFRQSIYNLLARVSYKSNTKEVFLFFPFSFKFKDFWKIIKTYIRIYKDVQLGFNYRYEVQPCYV